MKLPVLLLFPIVCCGAITFTDIPDSTVYQFPHAGRTPGRAVVISGTYTGSPASISAKVIDYNTDTLIQDWAVIDASPSGGTFSDTLTGTPRGGPYRLIVKTSLSGDTLRGANKWGVGEVIACFGQSNIVPQKTGGTPNIANGFAVKYISDNPRQLNDNWMGYGADTLTSILPSCSNKILSDIANLYPIAFCGYALGGSQLVNPGGGIWYWSDRNTGNPADLATLYGQLWTKIKNQKPNSIIMYQGESDAGRTVLQYTTAFNKLLSDLTTDFGYTPIVFIVQIRGGVDSIVASWITSPQAHSDLDNDTTILLSACTYDLSTFDGTHLSAASQNICGRRLGHTIARFFNDSITSGYRFKIDSSRVTSRGNIRCYLKTIVGNTVINNPVGRISYKSQNILKAFTDSVITGSGFVDVNAIRILQDSTWVFEYDKLRNNSNPSADVIYDSDSLPLEPER